MPPARERVSFPRSRADNHHNAEQAGNSFFLKIGTFCSKQAVCKTSVERQVNLRLRCILIFSPDTSSSGGHGKHSNGRQMNCTSRLKRRRQLIEATQYLLDGTTTPKNNGTKTEKRKRSLETGDETIPVPPTYANQPTDPAFLRKKTGAAVTVLTLTAVHTYLTVRTCITTNKQSAAGR